MKIYEVFVNQIKEIDAPQEDFGSSDYMELHYNLFDEGQFNVPFCDFRIYERKSYEEEFPLFILETGNRVYQFYIFNDFMSIVHYLKDIDLIMSD